MGAAHNVAKERRRQTRSTDGKTTEKEFEVDQHDQHVDPPLDGNELLSRWHKNRATLPTDFSQLLDPSIDDKRRGDLFEAEDEEAMEQYAWAIPDERALRICAHHAPLVEMGAGAGYWARLLRDGQDVGSPDIIRSFDRDVGDKAKAAGVPVKQAWTQVEQGGVEKLSQFGDSTLLLLYPDDLDMREDPSELPLSVAALKCYKGQTVIHVGELLGQTLTVSMEGQDDPATPYPWGRSTDPRFQLLLSATFHKVLQVPLPNWGSVQNCLTLWKRTATADIDGDRYAYIPEEEKLDFVMSCPATAHLVC